ncbi:hypothetical protein ABEO47_00985 [Heyndrickxia faecalis]|uniref:hypothetical protein n=1 Tax=Heyndrickxia TaxID=2837504 RepID=UPI0028F8F326|nr:hypothetical protein [Heyndrickxia coagulans]MDT9754835.1 hypothetical protein [Heyndrickxia coagulans]
MKKVLFACLALLLLCVLTGWNLLGKSGKPANANTFKPAKLTANEEAILHASTDNSFLYQYRVDPHKYKSVRIWLEEYKYGKLVNGDLFELEGEAGKKGTIMFTASPVSENSKRYKIIEGIYTGKGNTTFSTFKTFPQAGDKDINAFSLSGVDSAESASGKKILGAIGFSKDDSAPAPPLHDFEDLRKHKKEIQSYATLLVVRCEFKNNKRSA